MKASLTFLIAAVASLCFATVLPSCKTIDNPSPHTQKVREQQTHSNIMMRNRRNRR